MDAGIGWAIMDNAIEPVMEEGIEASAAAMTATRIGWEVERIRQPQGIRMQIRIYMVMPVMKQAIEPMEETRIGKMMESGIGWEMEGIPMVGSITVMMEKSRIGRKRNGIRVDHCIRW